MSYEEKGTWLFGAIAVVGYSVYLVLLIAVGILGGIVLGIASPKEAGVADVRDKQINRFGEQIGQSFIAIGALGALVLSLLEVHWFWISNALYLGFALSGVLSVIAKLVAYRRGFHAW